MAQLKTIAVIPARLASTRFPEKVIAELGGKPIVQWVWERTSKSRADRVLIATDSEKVKAIAEGFGAEAVMTSPDPSTRAEIASNPNLPKVVVGADGSALYFSRSEIPFLRTGGTDMPLYRHWGIYAYRRAALERFVSLPESPLEKCEKLEQLRALENGMKIKVVKTHFQSIGIDTPEDLVRAENYLREHNEQ